MQSDQCPVEAVAAADALCDRYLTHARVQKRLAQRTLELYALDLHRLAALADAAGIGLLAVEATHIRRWIAQMHSQGRSARGIALILSGSGTKTLPVAIAEYGGEDVAYWSISAAAAIAIMLPPLILTLFAQKHLVRGMTVGAVKG